MQEKGPPPAPCQPGGLHLGPTAAQHPPSPPAASPGLRDDLQRGQRLQGPRLYSLSLPARPFLGGGPGASPTHYLSPLPGVNPASTARLPAARDTTSPNPHHLQRAPHRFTDAGPGAGRGPVGCVRKTHRLCPAGAGRPGACVFFRPRDPQTWEPERRWAWPENPKRLQPLPRAFGGGRESQTEGSEVAEKAFTQNHKPP